MLSSKKKSHLWITTSLLGLSIVVIVVLWRGLAIDTKKIPSTLLNKPAANFVADWIQGKEVLPSNSSSGFNLEEFKGKTVVLNFWASWCVSCREEALELEAFWKTVDHTKIAVVGIAIQDTVEAALQFAQEFGKTYILGLDTHGKIAIDYGVTGVPETFIISPEGIVVHKEVGPVTRMQLESLTQVSL